MIYNTIYNTNNKHPQNNFPECAISFKKEKKMDHKPFSDDDDYMKDMKDMKDYDEEFQLINEEDIDYSYINPIKDTSPQRVLSTPIDEQQQYLAAITASLEDVEKRNQEIIKMKKNFQEQKKFHLLHMKMKENEKLRLMKMKMMT